MSNDSSKAASSADSTLTQGQEQERIPTSHVAWGPGTAILYGFLGAAIGVQVLLQFAVVFFMMALGMNESAISSWMSTISGQFIYTAAAEVSMFAAIFLYLTSRNASLRSIGLAKPRPSYIGIALLGVIVYFALYMLAVVIVSVFLPSIDLNQRQELGFNNPAGIAEYLMIFISLVVLPPIAEEVVFRGFIFSGLRSKLRFVPTALITSVLFAVLHLQFDSGAPLLWVAAIDTFILSFVLCFIREKTNSIWPTIGVHAIKNGIAFMLLYIFVQ